MSSHYILDGKTPVPCDLMTWANALENRLANGRDSFCVANDTVEGAEVSTVFLGLDHAFGSEPPLLFETMIFGGPHNDYTERYSTWDEAEAGHKRACNLVKGGAT